MADPLSSLIRPNLGPQLPAFERFAPPPPDNVVAAELAAGTRVHGRIVIVGVYKEPTALDLQAICFKEQSLVGVRVYTSADVTRAIELIAADALSLSAFPTKAFDLADTGAAFAAATRGQDCLKVLVTPLHGKADA